MILKSLHIFHSILAHSLLNHEIFITPLSRNSNNAIPIWKKPPKGKTLTKFPERHSNRSRHRNSDDNYFKSAVIAIAEWLIFERHAKFRSIREKRSADGNKKSFKAPRKISRVRNWLNLAEAGNAWRTSEFSDSRKYHVSGKSIKIRFFKGVL